MSAQHLFSRTRAWVKNSLYAQMLFVALAFALMVIASYIFVSDIERENLRAKVKDAISHTEANIKADMLEPETALAAIAETIHSMILSYEEIETVRGYIHHINEYMQGNEKNRLAGVMGFYGFFDVYGGRYFTERKEDWLPPEGYVLQERPWYQTAVEADGDIGVTEPYNNIRTGDIPIITFSRCIFDEDGERLGVICLDIKLDRIRQHTINTQFTKKGYGFLLSRDMELIAHPLSSILGMRLNEVKSRIAGYEDELRQNGHISEVITTDYRGIESIVFIKELQNGWYMGVVTPKNEYYQSTRNLAKVLATLGTALAMILIIILVRISAEKNKSDERMRIIFNAMPLGANIHNKNFEFFECNEGVINLFGLANKREYLEKFYQLLPKYQPDGELSSKKMAEFNDKAFADGYCRFEWMHQKLNGDPIPCEITLVRAQHNDEFVLVTYIRDLRELKEADERTHIMFDATPLGANFWNQEYNVIDCNQETIRLFDMPNKQEYLKRFFDLSPKCQPDGRLSREKSIEFVKKAFEEGYYRFEWIHQKLDGEPIPCEVTLIRVKYKDGHIVVGYTRDLREQKAMLAEIYKESEKSRVMAHWYNSILNAIPLPITVTDADTKWTFINAAVEKHLGITLEDAIGKPCSNWGANICNTPYCGIACAKRGLKQTYFSEGDSSYQIDVAILKDLNGKTMGYIEVVQDITNLKLMTKKQADAEAANLAKSAFLAKVSHEVRTPMNAILGITEIQLQNEKLSPDTQEALGVIYNSGYLLLGIINDILDLSKIEAGKLELVPVNYDVPSLINDIVHLNVMRYDSKPIEFKLQVDENIPTTLFGDELRIKQILNNLLSNAFKYTESGEVSLSVAFEAQQGETAGIMLVFRVSDTGQGMTTEQLNKLFDEYTRFNTESNRTTVGTGLGMAITKYLVRMMNGAILVESKPGKGSTFTVRLPQRIINGSGVLGKELAKNLGLFNLGRAAQMKKAPQIIREYMPYGRVLVVDDVETNLYVAKGLMTPYGLSVETATSGFESLEKIKNGAVYDIIFMDHFMPKMDGIETTKKLRELGYTRPIVALTANALAGQAEMFAANGFDDFISKPIDLRQLNAVLNRLIRDKYPVETIEAARQLKDNLKKNSANANIVDGNLAAVASRPSINPGLAKVFTRDAEKAAAVLEAIQKKEGNYGDEDIQAYIINVHAMKSALANIGETALSDSALKLEQAGRARDTAVMTAETPAFLNSLRAFIGKIKPKEIDEGGETADANIDRPYLLEKLAVLRETCAEYNKKAAKDAVAELRQKTWPRPVNKLLDAISEHLLHSEFADAAGLAENYAREQDAQLLR
jgi:signal transduction histidine kinase/FixJ family two-component response regulator/HPt (histidine-containing phosphotransfer) domain-containing protein